MRLHDIQPSAAKKGPKRVGRGGKRGTYSGKGMKGQKARSGSSVRPGFRGGDTPLWKLFPKQRGATKKVGIKHRRFAIRREKSFPLNLARLNSLFEDGAKINPSTLLEKGIIDNPKRKVKILAQGVLDKKLEFSGLLYSASAIKKIKEAGGKVDKDVQ